MELSGTLKTAFAVLAGLALTAAVAAVGAAMARPGPPEDARQRITAS